jgi:hypothetical protein
VTTLNPAVVHFGDSVTAEVEVDYGATVTDGSIRIVPSFVPYVIVAQRTVPSGSGVLRIRYSLLCVTDGCLPTRGVRMLRFEPVGVTGSSGGSRMTVAGSWPALRVLSRLSPSDLTGGVRFRAPALPPTPRYTVDAGALALGLIAAATLCGLTALALAAGVLARRRWRGAHGLTPLELAIAYVRNSVGRSDADRRRALELLAEAIGDEGEPDLAGAAADAAWSRLPPSPRGAGILADRAAQLGGGRG